MIGRSRGVSVSNRADFIVQASGRRQIAGKRAVPFSCLRLPLRARHYPRADRIAHAVARLIARNSCRDPARSRGMNHQRVSAVNGSCTRARARARRGSFSPREEKLLRSARGPVPFRARNASQWTTRATTSRGSPRRESSILGSPVQYSTAATLQCVPLPRHPAASTVRPLSAETGKRWQGSADPEGCAA